MLGISNFDVNKIINRGNSAIVFKAIDKCTKRAYAIKRSLPGTLCGKYFFHNEIEIMKKIIPHLNCIRLFNHWEHDNHIYLQIELCDGTLSDLIDKKTISHLNIWTILLDIAFGIEHIHKRNIVHLDLKPENILISKGKYKIRDFGLALDLSTDTEDPELHIGDRKYIALEVLQDNIFILES
ncbi:15988_t:CDS:2 [Gigaspora margarita]|uniref:15988_t:CDS:1 n=1 Tax=Gigaspora margarita TaxID=4874 RepID=A0ABN7UI00_GIGMA|nr:15988_t:CDS:2 [Gigaspora margarita]